MFLNTKVSIFILLMCFASLNQAREVWLAQQWQNKANSASIQTAKLSLSSCEDTADYLWYQVTESKSLSHSDIPEDIFIAIASHEWFVDHPNAKLYYEGKKNGIPVIQLDTRGISSGLVSVQHPQCDIGDSCNTARQVPLDYVFTNEDIRYAGDKDVFKFNVEELKTIELYSTGEANVIGTLLNSSCQSIQVSQGFDQTNNFNIERILQPGDYYIQLQDQDSEHFGDYYDLHLVAGASAKTFNDTSDDQTIVGTDFGDVINQVSGDDQIYGGLGNDIINVRYNSPVIHFSPGDGQDTINVDRCCSSSNKPKLLFADPILPSDISVSRQGNALHLSINNSTDQVIVSAYFQGEYYAYRLESIEFASDGTVWDWAALTTVLNAGTDNDDTIVGFNTLSETFYGGKGNDTITPNSGNDTVYAGEGDDTIHLSNGNDHIYGGLGNDIINVRYNSPVIHFSLGDGQDTINVDRCCSSSNKPKLLFADPILPSDISVSRQGNALHLSINNSTDQVIVSAYFQGEYYAYRLESIEFASDGTVWDWAALTTVLNAGTDNDDTIVGFNTLSETFYGGKGNDTITPNSGNDTVYAGEGDDTIHLSNGNDHIYGGLGNDIINVRYNSPVIHFSLGDGQDTINVDRCCSSSNKPKLLFADPILPSDISVSRQGNALHLSINNSTDQVIVSAYFQGEYYAYRLESIEFANDGTVWDWAALTTVLNAGTDNDDTIVGFNTLSETFYGGKGNDTITPNSGNDTVYAGEGDDTIHLSNGNDHIYGGLGNDIINVRYNSPVIHFSPGDGQDTINVDRCCSSSNKPKLLFADPILPSDISVSRQGNALHLSINNSTDQVIVSAYFQGEYYAYRLESIEFASDGTVWDWAALTTVLNAGTDNDDTIVGFNTLSETFYGGKGNDTITPNSGNDTVYAGEGDDTIHLSNGNDHIYGGLGNDIINVRYNSPVIHFSPGDGQDTINVDRCCSSSNKPKLLFADPILPSDISVSRQGNALHLSINNSTDQVIVSAYFQGEYYAYRLESIEFASDGTVWDWAALTTVLNAGTDNDDTIVGFNTLSETFYGGKGNDTITPNSGNDTVYAGEGDDTIHLSNGNDHIYGGLGNDIINVRYNSPVIHFSLGDGQDTINVDRCCSSSNKPKLLFADPILPSDISVSRQGNALHLSINNSTDQVIVSAYFQGEYYAYRLESIEFASDGTVWDWAALTTVLNAGTDNDDTIVGFNTLSETFYGGKGNDTITPNSGNDTVYAGEGDDTIHLSNGNDHIYGGLGNDIINVRYNSPVIHFSPGDGQDTINVDRCCSSSNKPKLLFADPILPSDISVSRQGNALHLSINNSTDQVIVSAYFQGEYYAYRLESIEFASDDTQWNYEAIKSML
ncbi:hypothetical protein C2869_07320 [Saccharobesus litoralis]|uniref:Haemolysin-type calcium binding-related domain-containing protein n=1 Tax=Saccharobesus litoralis TaxID=2172099 RepID=A0A2S0VPV6_9ALTE|nr:calcium-binding protein [Saccharobesus litoralis]AWB66251.1 hypothetical protein C2869_07320 [Saccharobesus litoralis]